MATLPLIPQGGTAPPRTVGDLLNALYPLLNAESAADLAYWSTDELIDWINEGLKRLARRAAVFIDRDVSVTLSVGTSDYALPARHLSTLHASVDGGSLRPANVREIEARSASWLADIGAATHYLHDFGAGLDTVRLYPTPTSGVTLGLIEHEYAADLSAASTIPLPAPVSDYLLFCALAEARRRESDGAMPEVADVCDGLLGLYEQLCESYWGSTQ